MFRFKTTSLKQVIIALCLLMGNAAWAAESRHPLQREDLALIEKQLARVERVIDRIEKRQRQSASQRVIFDTDQLRFDLRTIRAGIRAFLLPPRRLPRQPPPLSGQYLEQERKP